MLPVGRIADALQQQWCSPEADPFALAYGSAKGPASFLADLSAFLQRRTQAPTSPNELMVSNGNSGMLDLVTRMVCKRGDTVLAEDPTYFLAKGIFADVGVQLVGLRMQPDGLDVEQLEQYLQTGQKVSMLYSVPIYHNPTGISLSSAKMAKVVDLAEKYNFVILSDEAYLVLHYGGGGSLPPKSFFEYDKGRGRVISIGSFSKILGPGLRLGWVNASASWIQRISEHPIPESGGGYSPFAAASIHFLLKQPKLAPSAPALPPIDSHLDHLINTYRSRCSALSAALRATFPGTPFLEPQGGYFIWFPLPHDINADDLLKFSRSINYPLKFLPGNWCGTTSTHGPYIRLAFSFYNEQELKEGVSLLHSLISQYQASKQ
uniref:Aminotransferase class I/classII large domain-containing protein n=1 Tax=Arcella intermedia TaxID=1963864 RepID=A0A6B2L643_9EUKA